LTDSQSQKTHSVSIGFWEREALVRWVWNFAVYCRNIYQGVISYYLECH